MTWTNGDSLTVRPDIRRRPIADALHMQRRPISYALARSPSQGCSGDRRIVVSHHFYSNADAVGQRHSHGRSARRGYTKVLDVGGVGAGEEGHRGEEEGDVRGVEWEGEGGGLDGEAGWVVSDASHATPRHT